MTTTYESIDPSSTPPDVVYASIQEPEPGSPEYEIIDAARASEWRLFNS